MSLFDSASLVVTPNGYKEDKLYSIKPTDGSGDLVVTRATTATRVNSDGLVEQVPYNLLSYSQEFDNAYWTKLLSTITTNAATAPDGTTTADKLVENTSNGVHRCGVVSAAGLNGTFSFYAKSGERTKIAILSTIIDLGFDLSNGTLINIGSGTSGGSIESVGNGWYRCSLYQAVNIQALYFGLLDNSGNISYTGNGTSGAYFWGAQLVTGTSAKEYFPTTDRLNVPRLDYTNSSCPSILVEPQRTNLVTYSEQFDNAVWQDINSSVTANVIASPSGYIDADKIVENTSTSGHTQYQAIAVTNGATYTLSVFAKSAERTRVWIDIYGGTNAAVFNLSNGTIIATSAGATSKIENYGNGWYKCSVTAPCPDSTAYINIGPTIGDTTNNQYSGNGTSGVYVWGAQLEAGSYATSYIPTVASSVTRNADVISKTGISSLIGQTEGTMFLDIKAQLNNADEQDFSISDGTTNNRAIIRITSTGVVRGIGVFGGNVEFNIGGTSYTTGSRYKIALAYKNNDVVLYINGTNVGSTSTTSISGTLSRLGFDVFTNGAQIIVSPINSAALWKTRLSNTELSTLTTI